MPGVLNVRSVDANEGLDDRIAEVDGHLTAGAGEIVDEIGKV